MISDTKKNPHPEWLFGANPGAIEAQEEDGQRELAESKELPRKTINIEDAISIYTKMGIKVLEDDDKEKDSLFVKVKLPIGWKVIPTEHSMWSYLVDNLNRKRASIFYKAAFYDRDAHISFNKRFKYEVVTYSDDVNKKYSDFHERKNHAPIFGRVFDGDKVIFETEHDLFAEKYDENHSKDWWKNYENLEKSKSTECKKWLDERYPEWNNIYVYW